MEWDGIHFRHNSFLSHTFISTFSLHYATLVYQMDENIQCD